MEAEPVAGCLIRTGTRVSLFGPIPGPTGIRSGLCRPGDFPDRFHDRCQARSVTVRKDIACDAAGQARSEGGYPRGRLSSFS